MEIELFASSAPEPEPKEPPIRKVFNILVSITGLFGFGLEMEGSHPILGMLLMLVAVAYGAWELFTSRVATKTFPGAVRVVFLVVLSLVFVLVSWPHLRQVLGVSRDVRPQPGAPTELPPPKSAAPAKERPRNPPAPFTKHIEHPSGFLSFDTPQVPRDYSVISAGKQFGMNFRSRNNSSERVLRAFAFTDAYILPSNDQSDRVALDNFSPEAKILRQKYSSGELKGPEVEAGTPGIWGTLLLHTYGGLTSAEAEGIVARRLRIYYVSWLAWTDLQNRIDWSDDCRWLQMPDNSSSYDGPLVWHFCQQ